MIQQLFVANNEMLRQKRLKSKDNVAKFRKQQEKQREKAASALRRNKKDFYQKLGKQSGGKGRGGKSKRGHDGDD